MDEPGLESALRSVGAAINIFRDLRSIVSDTRATDRLSDLGDEFISLQQSCLAAQQNELALIQRVRNLEEELMNMKTWDRERERYELRKLSPGGFVYAVKEDARGSEPPHYLCANCFELGKKSYLQSRGPSSGLEKFDCNTCGQSIYEGEIRMPAREPRSVV